MLKNTPRTATIIALTDCICISLERWQFRHVISKTKGLCENLEKDMAQRMALW